MTRLPVLESTIKQLYGTAMACAFPDCAEPLLRWVTDRDTPILNSRIAHIAAASRKGPRYDQTMTDEERRGFENLLLLCLPHAEQIDSRELADRYPPETLRSWKTVQLQTAPSTPPTIPDELLERAVILSMGDVLMDFREATIDLGGKAALAPGAGGSGGGAIGPGARGGDGGRGGDQYEFSVTGLEVLGEVPIEVGRAGRGGIGDMPGEAGGHSRFGNIVAPGGGRKTHEPFADDLKDKVNTSVSSAVLSRYGEIANGLAYLSAAGWSNFTVAELPAPFLAALCVWVDVSWTELEPKAEIPLEVIAELITPSKTATFSVNSQQVLMVSEVDGFARLPFLIGLAGTLHDDGLHVLDVTTNTGARLGQFLHIGLSGPPDPDQPVEPEGA